MAMNVLSDKEGHGKGALGGGTNSVPSKCNVVSSGFPGVAYSAGNMVAGPEKQTDRNTKTWSSLFSNNRQFGEEYKLEKVVINADLVLLEADDVEEIRSWGHFLIGFVAGRFPGRIAFENQMKSWGVACKLIVHPSGWVMFKFHEEGDKLQVLTKGPYSILGRPLILKEMPEYFDFSDDFLCVVPCWINLPGLPLECWNKRALSKIASAIGTPITMDRLTAARDRVAYARILVEVDTSKPIKERVKISLPNGSGLDQMVKYETAPMFCSKCKRIGHLLTDCMVPQHFQRDTRRTRDVSRTRKGSRSRGASQIPQPRMDGNPGTSGVKGTEAYEGMKGRESADLNQGSTRQNRGRSRSIMARTNVGPVSGNTMRTDVPSTSGIQTGGMSDNSRVVAERDNLERPDKTKEVEASKIIPSARRIVSIDNAGTDPSRTEPVVEHPVITPVSVDNAGTDSGIGSAINPVASGLMTGIDVQLADKEVGSEREQERPESPAEMEMESKQAELGPYLKDAMAAKTLGASSMQVDIEAAATYAQLRDSETPVAHITETPVTNKGSATNYVMDLDLFRQKVWELVNEDDREHFLKYLKQRQNLDPVCSKEELGTEGFVAKVAELVQKHERKAFIARIQVIAEKRDVEDSTEESDDSDSEDSKNDCETDWTVVGRGGRAKGCARNGRRGRGGRGSRGRRGR